MKFGSLFSGIGGMDLGLERAGMECAWQVEIDDYCTRVLEKHWPDVRRYRNVKEVGRHNLEAVDLIAGGFPCQPHSVAGKRRGAADDRNLWPEYLRIVRELKPRYVLAENVPGIITTYLDTVLSDLEGQGYTCATFDLPAVAFDAPHRRHRIFIVAHGHSVGNVGETGSRICDVSEQGHGWRNHRGRSHADAGPSIKTKDMADTDGQGLAQRESKRGDTCQEQSSTIRTGWWSVEPDVGRVAHGVASRVERLRGLGNAVVPQVAEWIGRRIMEFDNG